MSFNISNASYPSGVMGSNTIPKCLYVVPVKLTFADFTTGGTASIKLALPADSSLVGFRLWTKTAFSGNGVTALALAIGITGTATKFLNGQSVNLSAGGYAVANASTNNIFQEYDPTAPGGDIQLLFTGTATTGNPTAGEAYVLVEYVR